MHDRLTGHLSFEQRVLLAVNVANKKRSCSPEILLSCDCMEEILDLKLPYFPSAIQQGKPCHASRVRQGKGRPAARGWQALKKHKAGKWKHLLIQKLYRGGFVPLKIVAVNAIPSAVVCSAEPVEGINNASSAVVKAATWQVWGNKGGCVEAGACIPIHWTLFVENGAFICLLVFDRRSFLWRVK